MDGLKPEPMPAEMMLLLDCKRWGVLPETGGYLDQPAFLLDCFDVVERVQHEAMLSMKETE
jgi:hypothetical protein